MEAGVTRVVRPEQRRLQRREGPSCVPGVGEWNPLRDLEETRAGLYQCFKEIL